MSSTRACIDWLPEPFIVYLREGLIVSPWANEVSPGGARPHCSVSVLSVFERHLASRRHSVADLQDRSKWWFILCKVVFSRSTFERALSRVSGLWFTSCTHDASHYPSDGVLLEWTPVWCGVIGLPFTLACSHWRMHPSRIFDALSDGFCCMCSLPAVGGALLHSLAWHPRVAFPRFQLSAHALV